MHKKVIIVCDLQIDLEAFITEKNCLNEAEDHSVKNIFEKNKSLFLESDCDPEVIFVNSC